MRHTLLSFGLILAFVSLALVAPAAGAIAPAGTTTGTPYVAPAPVLPPPRSNASVTSPPTVNNNTGTSMGSSANGNLSAVPNSVVNGNVSAAPNSVTGPVDVTDPRYAEWQRTHCQAVSTDTRCQNVNVAGSRDVGGINQGVNSPQTGAGSYSPQSNTGVNSAP